MSEDNRVIQSLWIGSGLGVMQQLSVRSYLANGHEFHLYAYNDMANVPVGAVVKDGNSIVPAYKIKEFKGAAQFYDYFAYALLSQKGGWAVGMDTICLKPFDHRTDFVFPTDNVEEYYISNAVMKAPASSRVMQRAYVEAGSIDTILSHWTVIGPDLLHRLVLELGLTQFVVSGVEFDPVPWNRLPDIINPDITIDLGASFAVHLRSSLWNGGPNCQPGSVGWDRRLDTALTYPPGCLWEKLKSRYL